MNPVLASIYGTGLDKTASAEDELDLNNISAADFLALLEEDESEKVANDEFDLSQMSAAELLELAEMADGLEDAEAEKVAFAEMVEDGSFEYADRMGRIMAHAFAEESEKLAGAEEIEVDLNEITGEQLLELMEAGYEFDGAEKQAAEIAPGVFKSMKDMTDAEKKQYATFTKGRKGKSRGNMQGMGPKASAKARDAYKAQEAARKGSKMGKLKGLMGKAKGPTARLAKSPKARAAAALLAAGGIGAGAGYAAK
jgi:hypothetical protein